MITDAQAATVLRKMRAALAAAGHSNPCFPCDASPRTECHCRASADLQRFETAVLDALGVRVERYEDVSSIVDALLGSVTP